MSDENKEKELDTVPEEGAGSDGEWQWDAAVPETQTEDITVEELILPEEAANMSFRAE